MRAWIDTYGSRLPARAAYRVTRSTKGKALLRPVDGGNNIEVEDPGWPEDSIAVVIEGAGKEALIEQTDAVWRKGDDAGGWRATLARWLAPRDGMREGVSDMTGSIYEGVVVKTENVAAGPNSDKSVSKIVHAKTAFIAKDEQTASGILLAEAVAQAKVDPNEVEVRVRKWA